MHRLQAIGLGMHKLIELILGVNRLHPTNDTREYVLSWIES